MYIFMGELRKSKNLLRFASPFGTSSVINMTISISIRNELVKVSHNISVQHQTGYLMTFFHRACLTACPMNQGYLWYPVCKPFKEEGFFGTLF